MQRVTSASKIATLLGGEWRRSPAYLGLAEALRVLIADGQIALGVRLPSERDLTGVLGVSRTTVSSAYALLREHGYLESRRGSGSLTRVPSGSTAAPDHLLAPHAGDDADTIDLTIAAPAAPSGVGAAYEAAVADLPCYLTGTGYYPSGLPQLREAIAARYEARGLPTDPGQVLVVAGALGGVGVAARALLDTGDRVLLENPTYPNALATLRAEGARLVTTAVDQSGWDLDEAAAALRQSGPKAAYLVPDFHNPTGMLLGEEDRARLGHLLRRSRTTPVVDESMVETWLDVDTMPRPMAAHAPNAVTVGSASKAVWGGLRVGWLRVPDRAMAAFVAARLSTDLGAPVLEQLVLTRLLAGGEDMFSHRREALRDSRSHLRAALRERLPGWAPYSTQGGLSLWTRLPQPLSSALVTSAQRYGVMLAPGSSFSADGRLERFIRLPYTQPGPRLAEAVDRLALAWQEARHTAAGEATRSPLVA